MCGPHCPVCPSVLYLGQMSADRVIPDTVYRLHNIVSYRMVTRSVGDGGMYRLECWLETPVYACSIPTVPVGQDPQPAQYPQCQLARTHSLLNTHSASWPGPTACSIPTVPVGQDPQPAQYPQCQLARTHSLLNTHSASWPGPTACSIPTVPVGQDPQLRLFVHCQESLGKWALCVIVIN